MAGNKETYITVPGTNDGVEQIYVADNHNEQKQRDRFRPTTVNTVTIGPRNC